MILRKPFSTNILAGAEEYTYALDALSKMHLRGVGVERDLKRAFELKKMAIKSFGTTLLFNAAFKRGTLIETIKYQLGEF